MTTIDRILRSNVKLKHLQLLVALDEFRHIGRVAEFLRVTQPAVSKMLAEIERMFGLELFARSPRGTEPTAFGDAVIRFARLVIADYSRTRDEIDAVASGAAGRTSVGAMVVAMPGLLVQAVMLLKQRSAQTTVMIEEGDLTRLLPRLRVGELDLIVGRLEPGYASPDLQTEILYEESMTIIARPEHPLCKKKARPTWSELAEAAWVVPPPWASSRIKLNQMFYKHRLNPPVDLIESASFLATMSFVRDSGALGFVARAVAKKMEGEGLVRALRVELPIELPPVGLIFLAGRLRTPTTEQLVDCLRKVAKKIAS